MERGGCFPGSAQVTLPGGMQKSLSSLAPGDRVMALSETGQIVYSQVLAFLHQVKESRSTFLSLDTEDGQRLVLTPHHLVFLVPSCRNDHRGYQARFASRAKTGDCVLISAESGQTRPSRIVSVSVMDSVGVYAPLTEAGTLFVDGVLVSSYALLEDHRLAHWAFGPLRFLYSLNWLIWGETTMTGVQTIDYKKACTKTTTCYSTLTTKDKADVYKNNYILNKQIKLSEPLMMKIQEKHSLQRQTDIHWYAKLLYRVACIFLDFNLSNP